MKSILTEQIENRIWLTFSKTGYFVAFEVLFGFHQQGEDRQYVDVAIYNTYKELICFEIKVSVNDFRSKAKVSFFGHKNYYAMPLELYEKVKYEIPNEIGVYVLTENKDFYCIRKCKMQPCSLDENVILWSFIRSRNNQTTISVKARTNFNNDILDVFFNHLEIIDIHERKVSLKEATENKSSNEYFISLFVSNDDVNTDFYKILNFMKNYAKKGTKTNDSNND